MLSSCPGTSLESVTDLASIVQLASPKVHSRSRALLFKPAVPG